MNFQQNSVIILFILLTIPFITYSQDVHRLIQEMERSRYLRMEERFLSQITKGVVSDFDVTYYRLNLDINPLTEIV